MIRLRDTVLGLLACGALLCCGSSPPTRYYALNEIAPESASNASALEGAIPVRLEPVAIPSELDRPELVNHFGPNQVRFADLDRWAAPLDEQIRRTLSDDLSARLPAGLVADPNEPNTREPRRTLSISIGQFSADATCALTLNASWLLQRPHASAQSGEERIQQPSAGACPAGLPAAMSRALAILADRLVPVLAR
ncbi:MAG TPA: PqiC family protein [Steroidobacteraceae bacterium]|jgi:uncharacterized lipoprotein YmbA|nr:PqiC family protein [Steroidobacteraceae bacterium]